MGPKASTSNQNSDYDELLKDYEIVRQIDTEALIFLKNRNNGGEYLLREFTFNDKKQYERYVQILNKRKGQLSNCKYVVPLERLLTKSQDQYCSTFYKIFALFQFTDRTLEDEIGERNLQKRKFQQKELWSILASCILGMSHLQRNSIKHESLRSNSILISQQGVVKVYDPIVTGCSTNYDTLISKRATKHIYLSPELADSLHSEIGQPHIHAYKSDIWTLGMIILEAGLSQSQDECYRDECSRIHWQTLQYNLHRFRQNYSEELTALLQFMISKQERNRPDWFQLEERVMKQDQSRVSIPSVSNHSRNGSMANQFSEPKRYIPISYGNPSPDRSVVISNEPINSIAVSQAVPIYQDPAMLAKISGYRRPSQSPPPKIIPKPPIMDARMTRQLPRPAVVQPKSVITPVRPSNIQMTRPFRNIFPSNVYMTNTKVDENLIVVPDEETYSDAENTPKNQNFSGFDQNLKSKKTGEPSAPHNQNQQFYNAYTATPQDKSRTVTNAYGVSSFQPQREQIYQNKLSPPVTSPPQNDPIEEGDYVIERYKQGSEYKGYKWNGMRHGYGIFFYQDGGKYDGEWKFNKMQGNGKLYYQSGKLAYEGNWANDQFSGKGVLYNEYPTVVYEPLNYRNLDEVEQMWTKYEGLFKEDMKNGRGVLFFSNGEYFEGEFLNDYAQGQGVYTKINGERVMGRWSKNSMIG